jgi:hypothetical protein
MRSLVPPKAIVALVLLIALASLLADHTVGP